MVVPARSPRRKFRPVHLRCAAALALVVYLYAVSQLQGGGQVNPVVENRLEGFAPPPDKRVRAAARQNEKIGIDSVVNKVAFPPHKQKLQEKLDWVFLKTGRPYQGDLWEISDYAPQWMKDYMSWHKEERQSINESNWESHRLLVMQCVMHQDTKCGGTADRLKDFLFVLREAYLTNRLLLIYWTLPARLEEYLLPPQGGLDWRAPRWLQEILEDPTEGRKIYKSDILIKPDIRSLNTTLIRTRVQSTTGFSEKYDPFISPDEETFESVYHDVWRIFFTPSPPIRALVQGEMDRMSLVPGYYAAAHLRALYGRVTERPDEQAREWTQNAVNCATELYPGAPVFFASEHTFSTLAAIEYGEEKKAHVVSRRHDKPPLHLDAAENIENRRPEEFYDTFVDLYLMGMSRCVTYNRGGFGHWALLIGYDASCVKHQRTSSEGIGVRCDWTSPATLSERAKPSGAPLFLEPMEEGGIQRRLNAEPPELELATNKTNSELHTTSIVYDATNKTATMAAAPVDRSVVGVVLKGNQTFQQSTNLISVKRENASREALTGKSKLPKWMTDYFEWHRKTRESLTEKNWNSTKYMIMSCLKTDKSCGGVTDRLKPLPAIILNAALNKRLLLIRWMRPKHLENFFLPPEGGIDWRLPSFLMKNLRHTSSWRSMTIKDMVYRLKYSPDSPALWLRVQTPDGGEAYYGDHPDSESTYADVFHDVFRTFFTPVPRLAASIDEQMKSHGLVPGEYAAAHFRCMYGNRKWRDPLETINVTVNGVNCASNLLPGAPVYFAADVKFAVDVAIEYGKQNSLPVASLEFNEGPSHFDKDDDWKLRNESHYDDTFLDLFMLAQSKCVAYSNGGYGIFGSLLSYDANCTDRFFMRRKITNYYKWAYADGSMKRLPLPNINIPEHLLVKPD